MYNQPPRKLHFSYHIWDFIWYVGLLHVIKIIACLTGHIALFLYPSLFQYMQFGKHQFLMEVFWKYFSACLIGRFSVRAMCFLLLFFFFGYQQFSETDLRKRKLMVGKAAIREIRVCSTCPKQSEYLDKGDAPRFQTCCMYNGTFYDNSLRLDHTNSYCHKEVRRKFGRFPKVLFILFMLKMLFMVIYSYVSKISQDSNTQF